MIRRREVAIVLITIAGAVTLPPLFAGPNSKDAQVWYTALPESAELDGPADGTSCLAESSECADVQVKPGWLGRLVAARLKNAEAPLTERLSFALQATFALELSHNTPRHICELIDKEGSSLSPSEVESLLESTLDFRSRAAPWNKQRADLWLASANLFQNSCHTRDEMLAPLHAAAEAQAAGRSPSLLFARGSAGAVFPRPVHAAGNPHNPQRKPALDQPSSDLCRSSASVPPGGAKPRLRRCHTKSVPYAL